MDLKNQRDFQLTQYLVLASDSKRKKRLKVVASSVKKRPAKQLEFIFPISWDELNNQNAVSNSDSSK